MPRIIAIETEPRRQQALSALVREHVKATLLVVASVRSAIEAMAQHTPDLITVPALISPRDEADLIAHMKGLESAPFIQMLTLPALDALDTAMAAPPDTRRGALSRIFTRAASAAPPKYDPRAVVAEQIAGALARARELRLEYAATLAFDEMMSLRGAADSSSELTRYGSPALSLASGRGRMREDRRIASRKPSRDVPWLSALNLSSGAELELINISNTGVLVETASKFAPGTTTNLQLSGPDTSVVVPVRFIRSDVARVDSRGVRYLAAAAFAKVLDIDGECRSGATSSDALAALFGSVLSVRNAEPAHLRFAQGLRQLVGARDVRLTSRLAEIAVGGDMVYFDVPGDGVSRTALQVVFDRNHAITDAEFKVLKAAACLTAAMLELERPLNSQGEHARTMALIAAGRVA